MKRSLLMALCIMLCASLAIGGTMAYLSDTASDVNVMTLGSVKIEQIEQERGANGELVPFTQAKDLYPAVYVGDEIDMNGDMSDNDGAVDKIVSVKNTGRTAAYVRTIIAYEMGAKGEAEAYLKTIVNDDPAVLTWDELDDTVTFNNTTWKIAVATYVAPVDGGDVTAPSLKQVYLTKDATNEVCEALGDTFDVLVLSQAVQAAGFADAATALNEAFGAIDADKAIELFDGTKIPTYANDAASLAAALNANADFELASDITISSKWTPVETFTGTFDGNGHTITFDVDTDNKYFALIKTAENAVIKNVKVKGTIEGTGYASGIVYTMNGGLMENCVNEADISANRAAGLVAWIDDASTEIKDCANYGDITGNIGAAGIANRFAGTMTNCANYGTIVGHGTEPAGGLVSVMPAQSTFNYCVNYGDVTSTADNPNASAAGILGHSASKAATMNYCANYGDITAEHSYASGIVYTLYGSDTSNYCYNAGDVYGAGGAGGISAKAQYGNNGKANNCLNAGAVSSSGNVAKTANKYIDSFYYEAGELYAANGAAADVAEALAKLGDFFTVEDGKIVATLK